MIEERTERNSEIKTADMTIQICLPFNLLQEIRLAHALMESRHRLSLDKSQAYKFSILKQKFDLDYIVDDKRECPCLHGIEISHKIPVTKIGSIKRPLIFPHGILHYLRHRWPEKRKFDFSFSGILTEKRKMYFESFFESIPHNNKARAVSLGKEYPFLRKIINKLFDTTLFSVYQLDGYNISFVPSLRGRNFPIKSWDERYYSNLLNSKFVLCPEGDHQWSYRFFEAIICGAIPIVQSFHSSYEGFFFYKGDDRPEKYEWAHKIAEKNYELCYKLLTIPADELNKEICSLLGHKEK